MKHIVLIAVFAFLGLAGANFFFQAVTKQEWLTALERTFFQFVAILALMLCIAANRKMIFKE